MTKHARLANTRGWIKGLQKPLSENIRNALVAVTFALVATIVGLSLWISNEHDRLALNSSHQMVEGALAGLVQRLESRTSDDAFSTEFYAAILEDNREWIYSNVAAVEGKASDISVVITPGGRPDFGWRSDIEDPAPITGLIPQGTLALLNAELDGSPVGDRIARSIYTQIGGDIWLLSMARVVPWEGVAPDTPDSAIPRLVLGKALSPDLLATLGAPFLVDDLRLGSRRVEGMASLGLRDPTGKVLGYVTWSPPRPAQSVHAQIGPPLATVTGLTVILLGIAASHIVGSARRLEDALIRAKGANRAKSQFLATVSHELRTPVTSIKGSLDLITSGALGDAPKKYTDIAGIAKTNTDRLAALIEDLLEIQKMETGNLDYHFGTVRVSKAVERAIRLTRPIAGDSQVKINTSYAGEDLYVCGDQSRLEQVITNVLSNAIKFSHPGGEVLVEVHETSAGVRVSVTDHGVGIPAAVGDTVFAPFGQVDSSDTRAAGGTGLGLHIAKRIMDAHHGVIDYRSVEGVGSTFFIELDRVAAPDPADARPEHSSAAQRSRTDDRPRGQRAPAKPVPDRTLDPLMD